MSDVYVCLYFLLDALNLVMLAGDRCCRDRRRRLSMSRALSERGIKTNCAAGTLTFAFYTTA